MARPVFHESLGQFFVSLRDEKGWTQRQAGALAERRELPGLTRQVLWRLEAGKTKNPEPGVLRSIAELYEASYEDLVARWVNVRFGVACAVSPDGARKTPQRNPPVTRPDRSLQRILRLWNALTEKERTHVQALMGDLVAKRGGVAKTA